ncbi:cryptochrome/photolyase family protein [Thioalkalivibrio sp.]|uniref:cryptochrome/photolyase family protein n=1 Tax=Thioalkalivibrio sp. TaxID=2093813 RepID=UPI003975835D
MATLRVVLGDQLSRSLSALDGLDRSRDVVLMMEVREEATYVPHHRQKLVLVLSAMRHFAESLRAEGVTVDYVALDHPENRGSFTQELGRALERHQVERVVATEPGEWRVWEAMRGWEEAYGIPVKIREDRRFLCSREAFTTWAQGRKALRMEFFYREMRRSTGWLMDGEKPVGGRWNYDPENRKPLPSDARVPPRQRFVPDPVTRKVMALVESRFPDHFGELENFGWAVTREQALESLHHFVTVCLPSFGDYQDAMRTGEDFLFHAVLSPYLNIGLLEPQEVCELALEAYAAGSVPLTATEGFLRQILGWREYVRGLYWLRMPGYAETNFLDARRPLPGFFWTADTELRCLRETIKATRRNAYAHHIQRLMITGNFALLAGLAPAEVEAWYLVVYADAFEWVELPNTHGMALHADGGLLGSKPYAASGAYIDRMSDYCRDCAFSPKVKLGEGACPFNYLYWHFLSVNASRLKGNPRMAMPYRTLARMTDDRRAAIEHQARQFLDALD